MLTDRMIQAALKKPGPEVILNDGAGGRGTGSLRLVVRKSNDRVSANWFGVWKVDGKVRKKALGRYPDVPLAKARTLYESKVRDALAEGRDPRALAVVQTATTVERMFAGYVAHMRQQGRASADEVQVQLERAAKQLGAQRLASEITPSDISVLLGKIYDRGARSMAVHMRAYLSAAFNWAAQSTHDYRAKDRIDWGLKSNPVDVVPKDTGASQPRERNLSADELRQLWHGIEGKGFDPQITVAVRLLICCGQRVRETLKIERHDLDFQGKAWTMPAAKTKMNRAPHEVPLPPQAVRELRRLMRINHGSQLFTIKDESINKALRRWSDAVGVERFQARDLRRTWKSRAGDAGIDRFTRDLIQQHAQGADTGSKHYDRADYRPKKRQAMAVWAWWLRRTLRG